MKGLLMYLVLAGIGYFTGSRLKKADGFALSGRQSTDRRRSDSSCCDGYADSDFSAVCDGGSFSLAALFVRRCWDSVRKGDEVLRIKSNETFVRCLLGFSPKEALAVTAGFGWYSIAPGIILEAGYATCGAMSFTHCVMREYFSLLSVPFVAKKPAIWRLLESAGRQLWGEYVFLS